MDRISAALHQAAPALPLYTERLSTFQGEFLRWVGTWQDPIQRPLGTVKYDPPARSLTPEESLLCCDTSRDYPDRLPESLAAVSDAALRYRRSGIALDMSNVVPAEALRQLRGLPDIPSR